MMRVNIRMGGKQKYVYIYISIHTWANIGVRHISLFPSPPQENGTFISYHAVLTVKTRHFLDYHDSWVIPSPLHPLSMYLSLIFSNTPKLVYYYSIHALCFQQEYLRLPKNLMLSLHDLTKKWPKMTSNDLKSKNYRKKTPTNI